MDRRTCLRTGLMAALGAATLSGCRRLPPNEIVFALGWIPNVEYANLWIALEKGYFRQQGIRLEYLPGGPNAPLPVVEVAAEQANLGETDWLPFVDALLHGNDFVIIAASFPVVPMGIITLPKRPMLKPADLVGGTFLVQGPTERSMLYAIFRINHLPMNYRTVPVGFSPEALLNGAGDAYFCYVTNQPGTLEDMGLKEGRDFFVTRVYDLGYKVPSSLIFTRRSILRKRTKQMKGFLEAMLRARALNLRDPRYAALLAVRKYGADLGLDLKQQLRLNTLQRAFEVRPGATIPFWLSEQDLCGPMYAVAEVTGRTYLPDPEKLMDMNLLEEAYRDVSVQHNA
jgi:ABC-type nitrate/sulfonate/bicarbonate transport system substrate-binding protein